MSYPESVGLLGSAETSEIPAQPRDEKINLHSCHCMQRVNFFFFSKFWHWISMEAYVQFYNPVLLCFAPPIYNQVISKHKIFWLQRIFQGD